jgi:hypothetical protein
MPSGITATQLITKLTGVTQSVLTRCSDDCYYVVKFTNNPEGLIALLGEVITARLGQHLGLPIPSFEYVQVGHWLLKGSPNIRISVGAGSREYDAGIHFGSRIVCQSDGAVHGSYLSEPSLMSRVADCTSLAGALVLDAWTGGSDRREVIFARSGPGESCNPLFIDHHRSFFKWRHRTMSFSDIPYYFRSEFYDFIRGWQSFEPWLSVAEETNAGTLQDLMGDLPSEWNVNPAVRKEIVAHLLLRRSLIAPQITRLREIERYLFPNWKGALFVREA